MNAAKSNLSITHVFAALFFATAAISTGFVCSRLLKPRTERRQIELKSSAAERAFLVGAEAYAPVSADKIGAKCGETGREWSLFCYEGYFFADLVSRPSLERVPTDDINQKLFLELSPQLPDFVRAIWLTSLGLALAQKNIHPLLVPALQSNRAWLAQAVDGWGFRKYQLTTHDPVAQSQICQSFDPALLKACRFGMGRAAFFAAAPSAPQVSTESDAQQGYAFAETYTRPLPGPTAALPSPRGAGAAVLLKQIWLGNMVFAKAHEKFYGCASRKYFGHCLDLIN